MSLFKWSTPARGSADRSLPLIPNEIYLHIFEQLAPPTGPLAFEELELFANLSCVCRFFANYCLVRMFEYIGFSGSVFRDEPSHKTSREGTLCAQIAAKQPLALALSKIVRVCHFSDWELGDTGTWAVQLFCSRFINTLPHMNHLRELHFSNSFVDTRHGKVIAMLGSLEKLVFDGCQFVQPHVAIDLSKERAKVKVAHLEVTGCTGDDQTVIAIHPRYLRTLVTDYTRYSTDQFYESALTELHLLPGGSLFRPQEFYLDLLGFLLARAPQSLEVLNVTIDDVTLDRPFYAAVQFGQFLPVPRAVTVNALPLVLDMIGHFMNLRTFTFRDASVLWETSSTEIRSVLGDKIGPTSRLECADIYGMVFRLVDGRWSEVGTS